MLTQFIFKKQRGIAPAIMLVVLGILSISLPLTTKLVKQKEEIQSNATGSNPSIICNSSSANKYLCFDNVVWKCISSGATYEWNRYWIGNPGVCTYGCSINNIVSSSSNLCKSVSTPTPTKKPTATPTPKPKCSSTGGFCSSLSCSNGVNYTPGQTSDCVSQFCCKPTPTKKPTPTPTKKPTTPTCSNGYMKCSGSNVQTCKNGSWITTATCNTNQTCEETSDTYAACKSKPTPTPTCSNGSFKCSSNTRYKCLAGDWEYHSNCPYGCSGTACKSAPPTSTPTKKPTSTPTKKPNCSPNGSIKCIGSGQLQQCVLGNWANASKCASGVCNSTGTSCGGSVPTPTPVISTCSIRNGRCVSVGGCSNTNIITGVSGCNQTLPICCKSSITNTPTPAPVCNSSHCGNCNQSNCNSAGCLWGYNGSSTMYCYSKSAAMPTITPTKKLTSTPTKTKISCDSSGGSCIGSLNTCLSVEKGSIIENTDCTSPNYICCKSTSVSTKTETPILLTPTINQTQTVEVTSIELTSDSNILYPNYNKKITAKILPDGASDKITWSSSDGNKALVGSTGMVKGVSPGEATITATASNGKSGSILIIVQPSLKDAAEKVKEKIKAEMCSSTNCRNCGTVNDCNQYSDNCQWNYSTGCNSKETDAKCNFSIINSEKIDTEFDSLSEKDLCQNGSLANKNIKDNNFYWECHGEKNGLSKICQMTKSTPKTFLNNFLCLIINCAKAESVGIEENLNITRSVGSSSVPTCGKNINGTYTCFNGIVKECNVDSNGIWQWEEKEKCGSFGCQAGTGSESYETPELCEKRISNISITKKFLSLSKGETGKLIAVVSDINGAEVPNVSITWKSNDPSVVTVNSEGKIKALSPGQATITASLDGYDIKDSSGISVIDSSIIVDQEAIKLQVGENTIITATYNPGNIGAMTWKVADNNELVSLTLPNVGENIDTSQGLVLKQSATIKSNNRLGKGKIIITAGSLTKEIPIEVVNDFGYQISPSRLTLTVGETHPGFTVTNKKNNSIIPRKDWKVSLNNSLIDIKDGVIYAVDYLTAGQSILNFSIGDVQIGTVLVTVTGCKENDIICQSSCLGWDVACRKKCTKDGIFLLDEICENGCIPNGKDCLKDCNKDNCGNCFSESDCLGKRFGLSNMAKYCSWDNAKNECSKKSFNISPNKIVIGLHSKSFNIKNSVKATIDSSKPMEIFRYETSNKNIVYPLSTGSLLSMGVGTADVTIFATVGNTEEVYTANLGVTVKDFTITPDEIKVGFSDIYNFKNIKVTDEKNKVYTISQLTDDSGKNYFIDKDYQKNDLYFQIFSVYVDGVDGSVGDIHLWTKPIDITPKSISIKIGDYFDTQTLKATNSSNKQLNISEVKINDYYGPGVVDFKDGEIFAKSLGGVLLEIYVNGILVESELPVEVTPPNIPKELNLTLGDTYKSIKVTNSFNQPLSNVKFATKEAKIVTVSGDGVVKANSVGTAKIEVYINDMSIGTILVTVKGCKKGDIICRQKDIGYPQKEICNQNGNSWDFKEICENGCTPNGKDCLNDCNKDNCGNCRKQEDCMTQSDYDERGTMTRPCAWTGNKDTGKCSSNPINGACNTIEKNKCIQGKFNISSSKETETRYHWQCEGLYGGDPAFCTLPKPGTCNGYKENSIQCITKDDKVKLNKCQNGQWQELECLGTCQPVYDINDYSYAKCLSDYCGEYDPGSTKCFEEKGDKVIKTCNQAKWEVGVLCKGLCTDTENEIVTKDNHRSQANCDNRYDQRFVCKNNLSLSSDISTVDTNQLCLTQESQYINGSLQESRNNLGYQDRVEDSVITGWKWTCLVDSTEVKCSIANPDSGKCSKNNCIACTSRSACDNKNFKGACDWNSNFGCISMQCDDQGSKVCLYGREYTCGSSHLLKVSNKQCCSLSPSTKYQDIISYPYYTVGSSGKSGSSSRYSYCNENDKNNLYSCTWGNPNGYWEINDCTLKGKVCLQTSVNKAKCVDKK